MSGFVFLVDHDLDTRIYPVTMFSGKTCEDLVQLFRLPPSTILAFRTSLFIQNLAPRDRPLDVFPQLCLKEKPGKYVYPEYCLVALDESKRGTFSVFVKPKAKQCEELPPFCATIDLNKNLSVRDIKAAIDQAFKMEHTGTVIQLRENMTVQEFVALAKRQRIEMECELLEPAKKEISMRRNIIMEIQSTEETYIDGLKTIVSVWQPRLTRSEKFTQDELAMMFKHFPVILQYHSLFLQQLKSKGYAFCTNISDIFLEFAAFFKVSIPYISNYESLISLVSAKRKVDPELFMLNDGRELSSFLITPVQRMPRYILFLRELLKATPVSHPDYPWLERASKQIQKVTENMDEATQQASNMNEIVELQQALSRPLNIMCPGRTLLQVAIVSKAKKSGKIFLFNDLVVVAAGDKKGMKLLWKGPLLEFKYFSSTLNISFYYEQIRREVTFRNIVEKTQFLDTLENTRMKSYPNPASMFVWSIPFLAKLLPRGKYWTGVRVGQWAYFVCGGKLMTFRFSNGAVQVTDTPFDMSGFTVELYEHKLYLFGGCDHNGEASPDLWMYNLMTKTWTKDKIPMEPRYGHSSVVYGDSMYVFGGRRKKTCFNDLWRYSFLTGMWEPITIRGAPSPRYRHSACVQGCQMYVYGGEYTDTYDDVYILDLTMLRWQKLTLGSSLPRCAGHRSLAIGSLVFFVGGIDDQECDVKYIFALNTESQRVTQVNNIGNNPPSLVDFGLMFYGGQFLVMFNDSLYYVSFPDFLKPEIEVGPLHQSSSFLSYLESSQEIFDMQNGDSSNMQETSVPTKEPEASEPVTEESEELQASTSVENVNESNKNETASSDHEPEEVEIPQPKEEEDAMEYHAEKPSHPADSSSDHVSETKSETTPSVHESPESHSEQEPEPAPEEEQEQPATLPAQEVVEPPQINEDEHDMPEAPIVVPPTMEPESEHEDQAVASPEEEDQVQPEGETPVVQDIAEPNTAQDKSSTNSTSSSESTIVEPEPIDEEPIEPEPESYVGYDIDQEEHGEWYIPGVIDALVQKPGMPKKELVITLSLKEGTTVIVSPPKKRRKARTPAKTDTSAYPNSPFWKSNWMSQSKDPPSKTPHRPRGKAASPFTPSHQRFPGSPYAKTEKGHDASKRSTPKSGPRKLAQSAHGKHRGSTLGQQSVVEEEEFFEIFARIRKGSMIRLTKIRSDETLADVEQKVRELFPGVEFTNIAVLRPKNVRQPLTNESFDNVLLEFRNQPVTYLNLIIQ